MTTAAQLDDLWTRLAATGGAQRQFRSLRAPDAGALDVHVALRAADGARCLLFDLPAPGEIEAGFEAGGLRLTRVALDDRLAMALLLEDPAHTDLFTTVCADVVAFAGTTDAADSARALRLVMERLEAWRQFLRSLSGGMSRPDVIGLTGELHVLEALLSLDPVLLPAWRAPDDGLHDFENAGHALEVKTTLGPGWRVTISTIDQLDETGLERLDLIQVRLFESPDGRTLEELIERIALLLPGDSERRSFSNALLQRGLAPDDRIAHSGLRSLLQQMTGYAVGDDFPRVRRAGLAGAIVDVSYVLDLAQLQSFAEPAGTTFENFGDRRP